MALRFLVRLRVQKPSDAVLEIDGVVLDLYAYLTARAYAGLGPGKPRRLPAKGR